MVEAQVQIPTNAIGPQPGKQTQFLAADADIVIYGGAAGGGKTYGLLLEAARNKDNPDFGCVIFRRTYTEITEEGALWDETYNIYPQFGGEPVDGKLQWTFPSGARVRFRHMQHEKHRLSYKGAQIPLICFDQLEEFSERQFFYMMSRNRSATAGIKPYIRATCNPQPGWLADFLSWWIDQDTGYAIEERGGKVRYFGRSGDDIVWGDSPAEVEAQGGENPKSITFIPSSVYDNEALLENDPGYEANLKSLPFVERERLLRGNWKVKEEAGKLFNRDWFEKVNRVPSEGVECRGWDFAATAKELTKDDPDYTASVRIRKVGDFYFVTDVTADQIGPAQVDDKFNRLSREDVEDLPRGVSYKVRWEEEPGSASKRETRRMVAKLKGIDAKGKRQTGDKVVKQKPWSALAEQGFIKVLDRPWTERFLTHMHHQPYPDWPHDDIADAFDVAMRGLTRERKLKVARVDFYNPPKREPEEVRPTRSSREVDQMIEQYEQEIEDGG